MKFWYKRTWLNYLFLPFSWLFQLIVTLRIWLFRLGIKKTTHFNIPVIIIGNITVGGTGKTPLVIWLTQLLKQQGLKPGIVSRGYGGEKQPKPLSVTHQSDPRIAGDEPCLIARQTQCPVFICVNRIDAVKALLAATLCDIVISDDGLQHYALGRDIEIAVVDGERRFGNGFMLPAGPLRESVSRLRHVDFIAEQGSTFTLQGHVLVSLQDPNLTFNFENFTVKKIHAVAGIGFPSRFFAMLRESGFEVIEHVFADHHLFNAKDLVFNDDLPIIMTEKDAVKCFSFADKRCWYVPVEVKINEKFQQMLLEKIGEVRG